VFSHRQTAGRECPAGSLGSKLTDSGESKKRNAKVGVHATVALGPRCLPMVDRTFVAKLTAEIGDAQQRVVAQTAKVERSSGDEFVEETAVLRNVVMQLEGLKLKLKSIKG
jgi:hypothetical protein